MLLYHPPTPGGYGYMLAIQSLWSVQCIVPENIHTSPTEGFLVWIPHLSGNSILVSHFRLKNWAFEIPLPLGISVNLPWGGHGYFWNYTIQDLCCLNRQFPSYHTSPCVMKMSLICIKMNLLTEHNHFHMVSHSFWNRDGRQVGKRLFWTKCF